MEIGAKSVVFVWLGGREKVGRAFNRCNSAARVTIAGGESISPCPTGDPFTLCSCF